MEFAISPRLVIFVESTKKQKKNLKPGAENGVSFI